MDDSYKHAKFRGKKKEEKKKEKSWGERFREAVTSKKFGSKLINAGNKGKKKK